MDAGEKLLSMTDDHDGSTDVSRPTDAPPMPLDVDRVFSAFADRRRRHVVYCLQKYENPMPLTDLADELAVFENDADVAEIAEADVTRVYVSLYHKHVPALADVGLVEYDPGADTVALSTTATHVEPLLEAVVDFA